MNSKQLSLHDMRDEITTPAWDCPLIFVGDVGGTNARLGFARQNKDDSVCVISTRFHMKNKDIADLFSFFKKILEAIPPNVVARVTAGVLSVPGPVTNGDVGGPFNNLKGTARLSQYPAALFPAGRSAILNDLEAGGLGVLAASNAHAFADYFALMWEGTQWKETERQPAGSVLGRGHCFVLAPGTGLGSSLIHYDAMEKRHIVLPLEFSSQTLPMRDDLAYIRTLAAELKSQPTYENMVSGAGLEFHYRQVVAGRKSPRSAREIGRLAIGGDQDACKAMKLFNAYLMRVASEASMVFVPLTVVIIGDNTVSNGFFYRVPENVSEMRKEALKHEMERYGFQSRVTYLRQKKLLNLNLIGCYQCGLNISKKRMKKSKL